jgi:hypothetical protein
MDAVSSSETFVTMYQTILRYIPEDGNLHSDRLENLKSYVFMIMFSSLGGVK